MEAIIRRLEARDFPEGFPDSRIALGIVNFERAGQTIWFAVQITASRAAVDAIASFGAGHSPEHELNSSIAVSAARNEWAEIENRGHDALMEASADLALNVFGRVSYFIRYVPQVSELLVQVASDFAEVD